MSDVSAVSSVGRKRSRTDVAEAGPEVSATEDVCGGDAMISETDTTSRSARGDGSSSSRDSATVGAEPLSTELKVARLAIKDRFALERESIAAFRSLEDIFTVRPGATEDTSFRSYSSSLSSSTASDAAATTTTQPGAAVVAVAGGVGAATPRPVDFAARRVLSDWMSEVLPAIGLYDACLWLTVRNFDRYILATRIPRREYTLAFIACFWIASKIDGTNGGIGPTRELLARFDLPFELSLVLQCEARVLDVLRYNVLVPTAYDFLGRYLKIIDSPPRVANAAYYCAERALVESLGFDLPPSRLAAASVLIGLMIREVRTTIASTDALLVGNETAVAAACDLWTSALATDTGCTAISLLPLARSMLDVVFSDSPSRVKVKYTHRRYCSISNLFEPVPAPATHSATTAN